MVRSSGPRTASTMQNSEAPRAAVSRAAARTSSVSRKGVALTGRVEARRLRAEVAVLGAAAGLGRRMPSTSTSGPHQASRTWWASDGEGHHGTVGQRGQRGELVAGQKAALVEEGLFGAGDHGPVRRTQGDLGSEAADAGAACGGGRNGRRQGSWWARRPR